jgi:DNA primase
MEQLLSCAEAREIDLVSYLQALGFTPQKVSGKDFWYCSPFRAEKTPSFKVDRSKNLWYDHGLGEGGNLIDFGVLFYHCTVKEFLQRLEPKAAPKFSFHPPVSLSHSVPESEERKLKITAVQPVCCARFYGYLAQRKIDVALAKAYLKEVAFDLNGKSFAALGFENNSGGFELRNEHFKGSSSPKDVTLIDHHSSENIAVFEGVFSFLSYLSLELKQEQKNSLQLSEGQTNFLVLNSLSFFEKSRTLMEHHQTVQLYLDRDAAGLKETEKALRWSQQYKDKSSLYKGYKDLNDFLVQGQKTEQRQSLRQGRHL